MEIFEPQDPLNDTIEDLIYIKTMEAKLKDYSQNPRQIRQSWNPDITIFDMCLALHMENNGSSDPLPANVRRDYLDNLELTLEKWMPSFPGSRKFDDSVKDLIYATLVESGHVKQI